MARARHKEEPRRHAWWLRHGAASRRVADASCEQVAVAVLHEWKVAPATHPLLEAEFRASWIRGCVRLRGSGGRLGFLSLN